MKKKYISLPRWAKINGIAPVTAYRQVESGHLEVDENGLIWEGTKYIPLIRGVKSKSIVKFC